MTEGTWGHSSKIGGENYVVFSVGPDIPVISAFRSWISAERIGHKSLYGAFNNQTLYAFIINKRDLPRVQGWIKNEAAMIYLGPCDARDRRPATFRHRDGAEIDLGLLHSCTKEEAVAQALWLYDPIQRIHFICSKPIPQADIALIEYPTAEQTPMLEAAEEQLPLML